AGPTSLHIGSSGAARPSSAHGRRGGALWRGYDQAAGQLQRPHSCTSIDPAVEEPIHWRLLTTHAVTTVAQALQIVAWYRQRWHIEQLFRTSKSQGLDLESSQVEAAEALFNLAAVAMIAATKIMQLVLARDGTV